MSLVPATLCFCFYSPITWASCNLLHSKACEDTFCTHKCIWRSVWLPMNYVTKHWCSQTQTEVKTGSALLCSFLLSQVSTKLSLKTLSHSISSALDGEIRLVHIHNTNANLHSIKGSVIGVRCTCSLFLSTSMENVIVTYQLVCPSSARVVWVLVPSLGIF